MTPLAAQSAELRDAWLALRRLLASKAAHGLSRTRRSPAGILVPTRPSLALEALLVPDSIALTTSQSETLALLAGMRGSTGTANDLAPVDGSPPSWQQTQARLRQLEKLGLVDKIDSDAKGRRVWTVTALGKRALQGRA